MSSKLIINPYLAGSMLIIMCLTDLIGSHIYIYHKTLLQPEYADIASDVSVVRLPPCDQIFNTILRCAHVALQLSTREGFEVKVTEALRRSSCCGILSR